MSPETLARRLLQELNGIKVYVACFIAVYAVIKMLGNAFIGDQDKRVLISNLVLLMVGVAIALCIDDIIIWISRSVAR
jgi:hypothetical protein